MTDLSRLLPDTVTDFQLVSKDAGFRRAIEARLAAGTITFAEARDHARLFDDANERARLLLAIRDFEGAEDTGDGSTLETP